MRHFDDFITAFLEYTENSESAKRLRLWAAISTVAATLERRTPFQWGHTTIYPNLYVVIVAPSGARKGEPLMIARDLMSNAEVTLSAERITDEALLKFVAESKTTFTDNQGRIRLQAAVTVVSEELSVLIRDQDLQFLADLTALYDCRDTWKYQTKGSGTDHLEGGCLNLLVSTAPDWLPSVFPPEAVGGGFTSRCFFVVENKKGKIVPDPNKAMPSPEVRRKLIADLESIKHIAGAYKFSKSGYDFYINWYIEQEEAIKQGKVPIKDPKLAQYISRRGTHIKKLGMVMAASESDILLVEESHLRRALEVMESVESNMSDAFKSIGHARHSVVMEQVLDILKENTLMTKKELMRLVQRDLDFKEFAQIEIALQEMGYIKRVMTTEGTVFYYEG